MSYGSRRERRRRRHEGSKRMLGLAQMPVDPARGFVSCVGYPDVECGASAEFTLMVAGQATIQEDAHGDVESVTPGPVPDDAPPPIDLCASCLARLRDEMAAGGRRVLDVEVDDQDETLN